MLKDVIERSWSCATAEQVIVEPYLDLATTVNNERICAVRSSETVLLPAASKPRSAAMANECPRLLDQSHSITFYSIEVPASRSAHR